MVFWWLGESFSGLGVADIPKWPSPIHDRGAGKLTSGKFGSKLVQKPWFGVVVFGARRVPEGVEIVLCAAPGSCLWRPRTLFGLQPSRVS
jgi:hypothetical protein